MMGVIAVAMAANRERVCRTFEEQHLKKRAIEVYNDFDRIMQLSIDYPVMLTVSIGTVMGIGGMLLLPIWDPGVHSRHLVGIDSAFMFGQAMAAGGFVLAALVTWAIKRIRFNPRRDKIRNLLIEQRFENDTRAVLERIAQIDSTSYKKWAQSLLEMNL